jgi:hypothetical protein
MHDEWLAVRPGSKLKLRSIACEIAGQDNARSSTRSDKPLRILAEMIPRCTGKFSRGEDRPAGAGRAGTIQNDFPEMDFSRREIDPIRSAGPVGLKLNHEFGLKIEYGARPLCGRATSSFGWVRAIIASDKADSVPFWRPALAEFPAGLPF